MESKGGLKYQRLEKF